MTAAAFLFLHTHLESSVALSSAHTGGQPLDSALYAPGDGPHLER